MYFPIVSDSEFLDLEETTVSYIFHLGQIKQCAGVYSTIAQASPASFPGVKQQGVYTW